MSHQALVADLDEVVHQRARLAMLSTLVDVRREEFVILQKSLSLTGGNCSRHLRILEDAGYVDIQKAWEGRRQRTWVAITPKGAAAYVREVETLRLLVDALQTAAARKPRRATPPLQPQIT